MTCSQYIDHSKFNTYIVGERNIYIYIYGEREGEKKICICHDDLDMHMSSKNYYETDNGLDLDSLIISY